MIKIESRNKVFGRIMVLNNLNTKREKLLGIIGPNGPEKLLPLDGLLYSQIIFGRYNY